MASVVELGAAFPLDDVLDTDQLETDMVAGALDAGVVDDQLYEVKSSDILQPGPAALTDGEAQLAQIVRAVVSGEKLPAVKTGELRSARAPIPVR